MLLNQIVLQKRNSHYCMRQQANPSSADRADTCLLWSHLRDASLSQALYSKAECSALFSECTNYVRVPEH